jgi:hypothetical protein
MKVNASRDLYMVDAMHENAATKCVMKIGGMGNERKAAKKCVDFKMHHRN